MKHGDAGQITKWLKVDFPVSFAIDLIPKALLKSRPTSIPVFGLPAIIYDFTACDFCYYADARYAYWNGAMYFKNEVDAVLYRMTYC
jgi:hypothetical protein